MIYLVFPDCVLYVINDTHPNGPDVQQLRQLRNDVPPPKNFNQLSGWTTGPHDGRGKAGNWQHLDDVRWIEPRPGDIHTPLKRTNPIACSRPTSPLLYP